MRFTITANDSKDVLFANARQARSFFERLRGLMFKDSIADNDALFFYNAPSIHTFFMRFPIDILFLDKHMKIIKVHPAVGPGKLSCCRGAFCTIECAAGLCESKNIKPGDVIKIKRISA